MKALTLHQPWASLVAVGAKTIETRSWATSYRGPLVIHAGARYPRAGDCPPGLVMHDGLGNLLYHFGEAWPEEEQVASGLAPDGDLLAFPLPLGAVVASCVLADVVPIGGPTSFSTGIVEGETPDTAGMDVLVHHPSYGGSMGESLVIDRWHGGVDDISDQLPFGDFTPGRYAWLLEDVKPTTERCPIQWGEQAWPYPTGTHPDHCPICRGSGVSDPVPVRGRQGLWNWDPQRIPTEIASAP